MSFGKNRIDSTMATPAPEGGAREYALSLDTDNDLCTPNWRSQLSGPPQQLPAESRRCLEQELALLELLQAHLHRLYLEQMLFVLAVSADGAVPIQYRALEGNADDTTTRIQTWETLWPLAG